MKPLAALLALLLLPASAVAQQSAPGPEIAPKVRYQAVTEIIGGDLQVDGALSGPSGAVVSLRRAGSFPLLLQLRRNFDAEMKDSADRIR